MVAQGLSNGERESDNEPENSLANAHQRIKRNQPQESSEPKDLYNGEIENRLFKKQTNDKHENDAKARSDERQRIEKIIYITNDYKREIDEK